METASSGTPNQMPWYNGLGLLEQNFVETSNVNVWKNWLADYTQRALRDEFPSQLKLQIKCYQD